MRELRISLEMVVFSAAVVVCALVADAARPVDATVAAAGVHHGARIRRQLPPIEQGNQVVDSIFQIPISTLNAVGTLIKTSRPLVRRTRERIQQYFFGDQQQRPSFVPQYQQQQQQQQQQQYSYGIRPYPAQYSSSSQYGIRPYINSYFGANNNNNVNNNRKKQQRDDPLPQGRGQSRRHNDDY